MHDNLGGLSLALVDSRPMHSTRGKLAALFMRAAQALSGNRYEKTEATILGTDAALAREVARAAALRAAGHIVTFSFMPRFPDAPHCSFCLGRFSDEQWEGMGFDFFSRASAFTKCLGETLERSLWSDGMYWKHSARIASERSLGTSAMSLDALAGFSDEQRAANPALSYSPEKELLWTRGIALATGKSVWVPAQLTSVAALRERVAHEPILREPSSNGLATNRTFEQAALTGLYELIERDAFMIAFSNRISPPRIDASSIRSEPFASLLKDFHRYKLSLDILLLPTDVPAYVICCILRDESREGPAIAFGAKAHADPETALLGAFTESYGVWHSIRALGLYKKKWAHIPDDQSERIAWWAQPEHAKELEWMRSGPLTPMPREQKPHRSLRTLANALAEKGIQTAAVPMSTPLLTRAGFHSVCVVSPELQPINLRSNPPYLGGTRLASVPSSLGYARATYPPYPHPFP